jgi:hypothetical protein
LLGQLQKEKENQEQLKGNSIYMLNLKKPLIGMKGNGNTKIQMMVESFLLAPRMLLSSLAHCLDFKWMSEKLKTQIWPNT